MRLLLHICCARCAIYPIIRLANDFEVTGYYFNPNIHPTTEYLARGEALKEYARTKGLHLIIGEYNPRAYFNEVYSYQGDRCEACYRLRLGETSRLSKELGYDYFTTTLLSSPYQKHDKIKKIGEEIAKEIKINFYYEDFRPGWKESQKIADEIGIYKQKYCGCIFSEYERYEKKVNRFTHSF
jgi:predicted adenine nucleotide alpha hydrolase (AANH) superfamily ATPase